MSTNEHKVEKEMKSYDVKKVLSDFMKTLGYKALRGCGGGAYTARSVLFCE